MRLAAARQTAAPLGGDEIRDGAINLQGGYHRNMRFLNHSRARLDETLVLELSPLKLETVLRGRRACSGRPREARRFSRHWAGILWAEGDRVDTRLLSQGSQNSPCPRF